MDKKQQSHNFTAHLPLLKSPVLLHSSRQPRPCKLTPAQCAFKYKYWLFWYAFSYAMVRKLLLLTTSPRHGADLVYGLPTVYFLLAVLALFVLGYLASYAPRAVARRSLWRRCTALARYCSYKTWRVAGRNSQSLGAYLLLAVGIVFFAAMVLGPRPYYWPTDARYGNSPPIATRSSWLALACLPFILVLGAKANFVTAVTGISHEKCNLWHNWLSRTMFVLTLVHMFPYIVFRHNVTHDLHKAFVKGGVWLTGVIAIISLAWLTIMSFSWIRNKYYEFFKATHFFFAISFIVFLFLHCDFRLTSWDYIIAAVSLYLASLLFAFVETFFGHGVNHSAQIVCETPTTLRITISSTYKWKPGQHVYLRFMACGLHLLTAHPLTICSTPQSGQMIFFVQRRHGLTGRLAALAEQPKDIPVLIEGPYGGMPHRWYKGFDHTLVVAGGSGCGLTLALIESWMRQGVGKLDVILATRDSAMRIWYFRELRLIAERLDIMANVPNICIAFCETSQDSTDSIEANLADKSCFTGNPAESSCAFDIRFSHGRPDTKAAVRHLASIPDTTVGIVVCGPESMTHDVGVAAADAQLQVLRGRGATEVYLHKEAFS